MMRKTKKGFTLIELLVVVAIIGILAAIAIPQFAKYKVRAFNSTALSDLKNLKTDLEGYYVDYLTYPDPDDL
jgi:type II secretion system protein G